MITKSTACIKNDNYFIDKFMVCHKNLDADIISYNQQIISFVGDINKISKCKYCGSVNLDTSYMSYFINITNMSIFRRIDEKINNDLFEKYGKLVEKRKDEFIRYLRINGLISSEDTFSQYSAKFKQLGGIACKCNTDIEIYDMNYRISKIIESIDKLYFINEIVRSSTEDIGILFIQEVIFNGINSLEAEPNEILIYLSENNEILQQYNRNEFNEGDYCYYDGKTIKNANDDSRVINIKKKNEILRKKTRNNYLSKDIINDKNFIDNSQNSEVYSYYVYTGCGNCSFIIINNKKNIKVIMVDCGGKYISQDVFERNIEKCINYIKCKFKIKNFRIDKVFITHWHDDHINGFEHYFFRNENNKKYLQGAQIWINLYYNWDTVIAKKLLEFIDLERENLKLSVVNPVVDNSNDYVHILYPKKNIVRTVTEAKSILNSDRVKGGINNSSVVYKVNTNKKSIIYPGDLEEEGWDILECNGGKMKTDYYCISHHGSVTGHSRKVCKEGNNISNICDCIGYCMNNKINILMTKDKTYNNKIISKEVKNAFNERAMYRTDQESGLIFLQLNWTNDEVKRFVDNNLDVLETY
jgi:hypothetical protein